MAHFAYILFSEKLNQYYTGKSENPTKRLDYHNSAENRIWTKRGQPWLLKTSIEFLDSKEASIAERFIKKQKSRNFIEKGWVTNRI